MGVNNEIIKKFTHSIRSWGEITKEHRDYILIKELYHCSPLELDNVEERVLDLHYSMLMEERKREHIQNERAKQRAQQQKQFKK